MNVVIQIFMLMLLSTQAGSDVVYALVLQKCVFGRVCQVSLIFFHGRFLVAKNVALAKVRGIPYTVFTLEL